MFSKRPIERLSGRSREVGKKSDVVAQRWEQRGWDGREARILKCTASSIVSETCGVRSSSHEDGSLPGQRI